VLPSQGLSKRSPLDNDPSPMIGSILTSLLETPLRKRLSGAALWVVICMGGLARPLYADTPVQTLAVIASYLESGDMNAVLGRFTLGEQEKSRPLFTRLDEAGRQRLATSFRNAKLKEEKGE